MKKFLSLAFMAAALSITASAATITTNCTAFPIQFSGSTGSGTVTCAAFNNALGTLNSGTLNLFADYTFGGASNDIKLTFTIGNPAGVTWASGCRNRRPTLLHNRQQALPEYARSRRRGDLIRARPTPAKVPTE